MDKEFSPALISAIQDSVRTDALEMGGREYFTRPVFLPPAEPVPETYTVHTLAGLVDFVHAFPDPEQIAFVHVQDPTSVSVAGHLTGRHQRRPVFLVAQFTGKKFRFDAWQDQESFNIGVQAGFVPTDELARMIAVTGKMTFEHVGHANDDGRTQMVSTRIGTSLEGSKDLPNPVMLRPWRTFAEIEQPPSPFILRARGGSPKDGQLALFETCDSGWQLQAILAIKAFLAERLPDAVTIIA